MTQDTVSESAMKDAKALISSLELSYLQELVSHINDEIKRRQRDGMRDAIAKIRNIAEANGIDLASLAVKVARPYKAQAPVLAKYRNPNDTAQEWTGRGRTPKWLQAALDAGADLETFKIAA